MRLTESLKIRFFTSLILLLSLNLSVFAGVFEGGNADNGKKLFIGNCASCHKITDEMSTGPGLKDVDKRWAGKDALIVKWIQNPPAVIASGDAYVKNLVAKFNGVVMTPQAVTEAEIKDIMAYIKAGDAGAPTAAANGPTCLTLEEIYAQQGKNDSGSSTTIWFVILGIILAIIGVSAANISRSLKNSAAERDGLPVLPEQSYWQSAKSWMWENKKFVSVIGLFLFCYFFVVGYAALMNIGVYSVGDGYTPDQPIAFSHAIHNCQNEIDCQYCHSSASKSKHAGIPSVNVCMNCHKGIKGKDDNAKAEIRKIYAAIGFNDTTLQYRENYQQKPIEWNKVHNLPDHVYFNHSQHVTVGKINCKNCHGPQQMYTVGHMPTAEEINSQEDVDGLIKLERDPFTMGWCLECHNKAGIDMASSEYYKEMHSRFKASELGQRTLRDIMEDGNSTVREMGGWECGKCHY